MSYFFEPNNNFSIYESPKTAGEAIRTWIYYAGTNDIHPSIDNEYHFGKSKTSQSLKDFDYRDCEFLATNAKTKIALYRDPVQRFISTFHETRVANKYFDATLDEFLDNFDEVIAGCEVKAYTGQNYLEFMFGTQTTYLGPDKNFYTNVVPYKEFNTIRNFFQEVWGVGLPEVTLPNVGNPDPFTGHICEFDLSTRQKNKVKEIYAEDYENGWF